MADTTTERICPQCFGAGRVPTGGNPLFKLTCGYCHGRRVIR